MEKKIPIMPHKCEEHLSFDDLQPSNKLACTPVEVIVSTHDLSKSILYLEKVVLYLF